jgi:hypothetical protein
MELTGLKRLWAKDTTVDWDDEGNRVIVGSGDWREDLTSSTNHCTDAMLYGWRFCHGQRYKPPPETPQLGTLEYDQMIERRMWEERKKQVEKQRRRSRRRR